MVLFEDHFWVWQSLIVGPVEFWRCSVAEPMCSHMTSFTRRILVTNTNVLPSQGEKNAGYDTLYHNMKYGNNASFKLAEFIRERWDPRANLTTPETLCTFGSFVGRQVLQPIRTVTLCHEVLPLILLLHCRAAAEETYAKSLQKLAKSATSVSQLG